VQKYPVKKGKAHPRKVGFSFWNFLLVKNVYSASCPTQKRGKDVPSTLAAGAFYAEGLAVGAFDHGRMSLVCANLDAVKRTVIFASAVVYTLLDSTTNGLVCFAFRHNTIPPLKIAILVWT